MKTKKLLSFMLTIVMVVSMMAALGTTASAEHYVHEETVGEKGTYTFCDCILSAETANDHITAIESSDSTIIRIDKVEQSGNDVVITYTCLAKGTVSIQYKLCSSGDWWDGTVDFEVSEPSDECWLDLDSTTTDILDSKELDQNYNLTVTTLPSDSGAVTKVKLSWEIKDINAARMDNMIWSTDELKWVVASSNTNIMDNGTAKFTLKNYSSVKVRATASFAAETGFNPTVTYTGKNGRITIDTANGNDTYSKTNVPTGTINVTVKPGANDFKTLAATASATKYGTYTVTISEGVSEYQSYVNNIATAAAPDTFVVDEANKTITLKDEEAFLYYGLVYRASTSNADDITAKLDADLDLDELVIANGFNCKSNFDGQNHTIANLTVNGAANSKAGFFKTIDQTGSEDFVSVKNLVLDNVHVNGAVSTGDSCSGILVGYAVGTEIRNVTVKNSSVTSGKYTGGIAGISYTDIIGCTVKDSVVSGQYKCGGLIGYAAEGNGRAVQNNTLTNVTINCANLLEGKDHYETGKVIGDWNAATGTYTGNTVTNVTIVNGSDGYTENEIGAVEDGCTIVYVPAK